MEHWTPHAFDTHTFAYVVEDGRGLQVLTLDEKKCQDGRRHSGVGDVLQVSF